MRINLPSSATFILFILLLTTASAQAVVNVDRQPPVVEYKTFDPAKPPKDMPELRHGEIAATGSTFRIQANVGSTQVSQKTTKDGCTTIIAVHSVRVVLQLHITIWTPIGVTDKVKAHEEGHRRIAEQVYKERAVAAARAAAAAVDGRRMAGTGDNCKESLNKCIEIPTRQMGDAYLALTANVSDAVNDAYDVLTQHGTNAVAEDEAIRQCFAQYDKDHPATRPATRPAKPVVTPK